MDVPELIPLDEYNPKKAQLQTCIKWLLSKAFGNAVPSDVEQPFYYNNQGLLCLKPGVANGLTSADLYCRACANIFKDSHTQWQGHWSVIQTLSRKGIYVMEGNDAAVTETVLLQTSPFKINAHLALIRSLMTAYTREIVTVERVVQAVRKFASFNASTELPYDVEDALLFWINKVTATLRHRLEQELREPHHNGLHQNVCEGMTKLLCTWVSRKSEACGGEAQHRAAPQAEAGNEIGVPDIPVMDDILKDLNDGCCLAALISFYCPDAMPLTEVELSSQLAIADSLHNLQLIQKFVERYIPVRCLHMTLNDLFYTPEQLKIGVLVFLAEMFYWLEVNPVPSVRDITKVPSYLNPPDQDTENRCQLDTAKQIRSSSAGKTPPISNATKRSFQASSHPGSPDLNAQLPPPRQPLLPKRIQQRNSLSEEEFRSDDPKRQSVRAWEEDGVINGRPHGDGPHGDGPHHMPHADGPVHSENPIRRVRPTSASPQLQSSGLTSVTSRSGSSGGLLSNVSMDPDASMDTDISIDLADIDGRGTYRVNPLANQRSNLPDLRLESVSSRSAGSAADRQVEPLMPAKLRPAKEKSASSSKQYESGEQSTKQASKPSSLNLSAGNNSSSSDTTPDEDYQTPSVENVPLPGEHLEKTSQNVPSNVPSKPRSSEGQPQSRPKQFEAFIVDTNSSSLIQQQTTPKKTGKPEGGEKKGSGESFYLNLEPEAQRPDSLVFKANNSSGDKGSPKTSFAEIKKQKDNGQVSPIRYKSPQKGALKGDSNGSLKGQKKTSFAALPNQTTWQESAQKASSSDQDREGDAGQQPMTTELINLRMQLEERRRQMETEKQRMAMQWNKQRQDMSKQAFIQVIGKKEEVGEGKTDRHKDDAARRRREDEERRKLEERRREEAKRKEEERERKEEERQKELQRKQIEREEQERREREEQERREEERRQEERRKEEERKEEKRQRKEEERRERERLEEKMRELEKQREIEAEKLRELERQRDLRESSPYDGSGRRKWNSPGVNGSGRPMSFHAGHEATPPPYQGIMSQSDPPRPESTSSADSNSTSGEYGTSLDRLNISLNELQGEIMRLSLQQDQIKSLVNEPRSEGEQASQKKDKFYLSGEPDVGSGSSPGEMRSSGGYSGQYSDPMRTSGGYSQGAPVGPPMFPQQGMPFGPPGPGQMYGPQYMPGYPYMPPGQPTSSYPMGMPPYPQPMYQQPGMYGYQGQWPSGVPPLPHQSYPLPHTQTATIAQSPSSDGNDIPMQSPSTGSLPSPIARSSPPQMSPQPSPPHSPHHMTESQEEEPQSTPAAAPPNQGFFISFESDSPSPRRQKPNLVSRKGSSASPARADPVPPPITARPQAPDLSDLIDMERLEVAMSSPPRPVPTTPAQAFIIDAEELKPKTQDEIDFEKKRQKIMELQMKRREETEKKKQKLEAERQRKADKERDNQGSLSLRQKQEQSEQKRAEEKARRDQIFQQYLARKAEREVAEEESKAGITQQVPRRPKQQSKAKTRPHSQPPTAAAVTSIMQTSDDKHSVSSHSHSSQEDLSIKSNIMTSSGSKTTPPEEGVDGSYPLAFGSLTQRRPPSPAWQRNWRTRSNSPAWHFSGRKNSSIGEGDSNSLNSNASSTNEYSGSSLPLSTRLLSGSVSSLTSTRHVAAAPISKTYGGSTTSLLSKPFNGSTVSLSAKQFSGSTVSLSAQHSSSVSNLSRQPNGPKLFVKPSQKSNRNIIINALSQCCLAGRVNTEMKNRVLDEVNKSEAKHFLVLFRDHGQQYRAIYNFIPDTEEITKISGSGPKTITNGMVERFYKYNSGAKSFAEVTSTKHISVSIDAITLYNHFWQKKVAPPTRKVNMY